MRNFIPDGENSIPVRFHLPNKETERKEPLEGSRRRNEIITESRRSRGSLRKSKIFENKGVTPSKSVDSFLKLQRVPVKHDEDQQILSKNKSLFEVGNSRLNRSEVKP